MKLASSISWTTKARSINWPPLAQRLSHNPLVSSLLKLSGQPIDGHSGQFCHGARCMLDRMIVGEHIEWIEVLKVILGSILHQEITRHPRDVESLFPKERRRPRQVAGRGD